MAEEKTRRLKQVATTLNIGTATIVEYLSAKGFDVENKPTTKISAEQFNMLAKEYASSMQDKQEASAAPAPKPVAAPEQPAAKLPGIKVLGKIDLDA